MSTIAELELELEAAHAEINRLKDELGDVWRILARIHAYTSDLIVTRGVSPGPPIKRERGRPPGVTKSQREGFPMRLERAYRSLPPGDRTQKKVAECLGITRRTLVRYLDRWAVSWPPTTNNSVH